MTDTVKIPRPPFERRAGGVTGRVEHDERGNAVWVRTRATDTMELSINPTLALIEDEPRRLRPTLRPAQAGAKPKRK
jgi:hypothetical protein